MKLVFRKSSSETIAQLQDNGKSPLIARLLAARGVTCPTQANYAFESLLPFELLKGAEAMAEILVEAIIAKKRLLIVADYDADGATACSVALLGLQGMGANVDYIIPDRVEHGYGLSPAIALIACTQEPKPDFIITVDNGIASHAGIEECRRHGVPVLVTDHHLPGETQPEALCIVNPNQIGCDFPSKALAGVGVMWYVLWALQSKLIEKDCMVFSPDFSVEQLLPIVAVGTVADVVPLDTNNRILVYQGLSQIRAAKTFPGIEQLALISGVNPRALSTSDIAFGIGPRINAAGRLKSMNAGVECLTTTSVATAHLLATELNQMNQTRKAIELTMVEDAVVQLLTTVKLDRNTAVLHSPEWHQGVIGIVAGRIKEQIWRPTFVLAQGPDGEYKGSGRSIDGFHLRDALDLVDRRNPGLLLKFGGHAMAAGVTIAPGGVAAFSDEFERVAQELLTAHELQQIIEVDGPLSLTEMTKGSVIEMKKQVWGQAFPEPLFLDEFVLKAVRPIGQGQHLSMTLEKEGKEFKAIRFRFQDTPPEIGRTLRVAYTLNINSFKGEETLQLLVTYFE